MRLILAILLLLPAIAQAYQELHTDYPVEVIQAKDGDTVRVKVHVWLDTVVTVNVRVRDVETPELDSSRDCERRDAVSALEFTRLWLLNGPVHLTDVRYGSFAGRVLGRLHRGDDFLADRLIEVGLGLPRPGRNRPYWDCE